MCGGDDGKKEERGDKTCWHSHDFNPFRRHRYTWFGWNASEIATKIQSFVYVMWKLKNLEYFIPIHCIICSLLSSLQDIDRMFGSRVNVARNNSEPTEVRKRSKRKHVDQISAHSDGVDRGSNLVLYCIWNINVMLMWWDGARIMQANGWKSREKWKWFSLFFVDSIFNSSVHCVCTWMECSHEFTLALGNGCERASAAPAITATATALTVCGLACY